MNECPPFITIIIISKIGRNSCGEGKGGGVWREWDGLFNAGV